MIEPLSTSFQIYPKSAVKGNIDKIGIKSANYFNNDIIHCLSERYKIYHFIFMLLILILLSNKPKNLRTY